MARETKFGYGYLLVGAALPYLIDKLLGPIAALIAASIVGISGLVFLLAGHLHKDGNKVKKHRGFMASIGIFALIGAASGAVIGSLSGAIWNVAYGKKAPSKDEGKSVDSERPQPYEVEEKSTKTPASPSVSQRPSSIAMKPDIEAEFVAANSPGIAVTTLTSDVVMREPMVTISAWNFDTRINLPGFAYTEKERFVKKGTAVIIGTFDNPDMKPLIKVGDRVLGLVMVDCPDCRSG
jgi:hypothetical protein